jgi:Amt family ammonium transporter
VRSLALAELSDVSTVLCILLILLVPLALAGLALLNTGLGRARSAAHSMMSSLCVASVAALVYFFCGFAWAGFAGGPSHFVTMAGKEWSWAGASPFFLRKLSSHPISVSLCALLGMLSAALAAMIPLGSGADRWRLGPTCASTALFAGITFPIFAHWVWGGGWLAQLGVNYGLGQGFLDAGGSGTVQAAGGLTALSIAWILGPRRGKYTRDGIPNAIPGHNSVFIIAGCLLAMLGWIGLNGAGAILYTTADPKRMALIAINTMLTAATAALTGAAITKIRFGRPDASLTANGWIGGLAASSAGCAFFEPAEAVAIGIVAGALVIFFVELLELRLSVDDPGGSISAHAAGGIWGLLAAGFLARFPLQVSGTAEGGPSAVPGQWLAQLVGIATLLGFVLPLTYGLNWLLNRYYPQRVESEGERQGMDLYELGAGAYPEFLTHGDEFRQHER